jgi:hypothetical protein
MLDTSPENFRYLLEFMSFKDEYHYQPNVGFTNQELLKITPIIIEHWFELNSDPGSNAQPTFGWSSSLEHYKKSILEYMPCLTDFMVGMFLQEPVIQHDLHR